MRIMPVERIATRRSAVLQKRGETDSINALRCAASRHLEERRIIVDAAYRDSNTVPGFVTPGQ